MRASCRIVGIQPCLVAMNRLAGRPAAHPSGDAPSLGRWVAALAWICLALSGLPIALSFSPQGILSADDSWAPMRAALDLFGTPAFDRLYESLFFERHVKLQYPPSSLLPVELLDMMGAGSPRALNLINAGLFLLNAVLAGILADALLARRLALGGAGRFLVAAMGAASTVVFYPVVRALQLGQAQIWLDVLFTAACLALVKGRPGWAGVAMGFAVLIKPQFLPLAIIALMLRRWHFLGGFAAVAGVLGLVALMRYGLHNHLEYLEVLRYIGRHGETFYGNNSVNGIMNRLLSDSSSLVWTAQSFAEFRPLVFFATTASGIAFMAVPFLVRPAQADDHGAVLHFGLSATCLIMASPVAWEHHYGVLPAIFIIVLAELLGRGALSEGLPAQLSRLHAGNEIRGTEWGSASAGSDWAIWKRTVGLLAFAWLLCSGKLYPLVNYFDQTYLSPLQSTHFAGALLLLGIMLRQMRLRSLAIRRDLQQDAVPGGLSSSPAG